MWYKIDWVDMLNASAMRGIHYDGCHVVGWEQSDHTEERRFFSRHKTLPYFVLFGVFGESWKTVASQREMKSTGDIVDHARCERWQVRDI